MDIENLGGLGWLGTAEFWTLFIVLDSKQHNVSETGSILSSDEEVGETYPVGPVRKS
jgi:hypothetical protein